MKKVLLALVLLVGFVGPANALHGPCNGHEAPGHTCMTIDIPAEQEIRFHGNCSGWDSSGHAGC